MKLFLPFLAGVFIAGLIFYFISPTSNSKNKSSTAQITFKDSITLSGIGNILIEPALAQEYIQNYQKDHDTSRDHTITYSIFFGRDAMSYMGNYFDTADEKVAGVRIFNIQYNKDLSPETAYSQRDPKQQSILFVPENISKEILWNVWNKGSALTKQHMFDVLNHGQLCPTKCPR